MKHLLLVLIAFLVGLSSCSSDNQEEFYNAECDTENVTFSATVKPIIDRNCKSCHSAGNASGGVALDTYTSIKSNVDNGSLIGSIKHLPGFSPMPLGGKLDDCTIAKIDAWINDGALDN